MNKPSGIYAIIAAAVKTGAVKVYIIGYTDKPGQLVYTEADSLNDAKRVKHQMQQDGHKPFIDVYTR